MFMLRAPGPPHRQVLPSPRQQPRSCLEEQQVCRPLSLHLEVPFEHLAPIRLDLRNGSY